MSGQGMEQQADAASTPASVNWGVVYTPGGGTDPSRVTVNVDFDPGTQGNCFFELYAGDLTSSTQTSTTVKLLSISRTTASPIGSSVTFEAPTAYQAISSIIRKAATNQQIGGHSAVYTTVNGGEINGGQVTRIEGSFPQMTISATGGPQPGGGDVGVGISPTFMPSSTNREAPTVDIEITLTVSDATTPAYYVLDLVNLDQILSTTVQATVSTQSELTSTDLTETLTFAVPDTYVAIRADAFTENGVRQATAQGIWEVATGSQVEGAVTSEAEPPGMSMTVAY